MSCRSWSFTSWPNSFLRNTLSSSNVSGFIQHLPEYPAACCGDECLNIAFLRGAIPRQEGAGFIFLIWTAFWVYYHIFPSIPSNIREGLVSNRLFRSGPCP